MHTGICYLFGAGTCPGALPQLRQGDFVMAIDGGFRHLQQAGIRPNLLVGDFDSLEAVPAEVETMQLPREKDDTDMLAGLREGLRLGFSTFHIYGGTGGRFDHTMANVQCLAHLARAGAQGFLFGEDTVMTAITQGELRFLAGTQGTLSAFSLTDEATGVYEEGLSYPLNNVTLTNGFPIGVSNSFTGEAARVAVDKGVLLVIYPREVAPE